MFVVALAPFKSLCYFLKIYFAADTAKSKPEADLLDLISRNRDIVYSLSECQMSDAGQSDDSEGDNHNKTS